jgi:predicted RNA polymerase sigma factor
MAFSLRFIAEMDLTEVAAACGVSLATIKRRLSRADAKFRAGARTEPELEQRLSEPAPENRLAKRPPGPLNGRLREAKP